MSDSSDNPKEVKRTARHKAKTPDDWREILKRPVSEKSGRFRLMEREMLRSPAFRSLSKSGIWAVMAMLDKLRWEKKSSRTKTGKRCVSVDSRLLDDGEFTLTIAELQAWGNIKSNKTATEGRYEAWEKGFFDTVKPGSRYDGAFRGRYSERWLLFPDGNYEPRGQDPPGLLKGNSFRAAERVENTRSLVEKTTRGATPETDASHVKTTRGFHPNSPVPSEKTTRITHNVTITGADTVASRRGHRDAAVPQSRALRGAVGGEGPPKRTGLPMAPRALRNSDDGQGLTGVPEREADRTDRPRGAELRSGDPEAALQRKCGDRLAKIDAIAERCGHGERTGRFHKHGRIRLEFASGLKVVIFPRFVEVGKREIPDEHLEAFLSQTIADVGTDFADGVTKCDETQEYGAGG